jgi:hypothetical protein
LHDGEGDCDDHDQEADQTDDKHNAHGLRHADAHLSGDLAEVILRDDVMLAEQVHDDGIELTHSSASRVLDQMS